MSNIDKRALREAAEKATPGPWYVHDKPCEDGNYGIDTSDKEYLAEAVVWWGFARQSIWREEDAKHIAAANPATVLALLDELERKEEQRANWFQMAEKLGADLDAAEKRIAELESDNAYIKNRHKELDLLIGKNILVMQAAIIEWQGTGDARKGLAWIYNTLFGPGELPDESEKDAQAYFDRKYAPLDEEIMNLHRWFWEQSEAERTAAAGKGEANG